MVCEGSLGIWKSPSQNSFDWKKRDKESVRYSIDITDWNKKIFWSQRMINLFVCSRKKEQLNYSQPALVFTVIFARYTECFVSS